MAKKKNGNNNYNEKDDSDGKKQKAASVVTAVVLKMDLHCEGCAGRVVKAVRTLEGVESVRIGDSELNKITVVGNLDPAILRQKVEEKTKKKVELISPKKKKSNDDDNDNNHRSDCGGGGGDNKKKQQKPPQQDQQPPPDKAKTAAKKEEKKPKELPVTTAVMKVPLHCQGCIRKIQKVVNNTKGCMDMSIDKQKDLVTVKGAIDMKILAEVLKQKLKRAVEIVPPNKNGGDEKKGKGGGEKDGKGGDGNDGEEKGGGGEKKGKKGGGGNDGDGNDGAGGKAEAYKMESFGGPNWSGYPHFVYGSGYAEMVYAPQLFSDENPNACSVM